jgi:hypothetical protein
MAPHVADLRLADIGIERLFVTALVRDPDRHDDSEVAVQDLACPHAREVYGALANLRARGEQVTMDSVLAGMRRDREAKDQPCGPNEFAWFSREIAALPVRADPPLAEWARTILRFAKRRRDAVEAADQAELDIDRDALGDAEPPPIAGVVTMSDVVTTRVEWLWPARIPLGMITMLDGDPGLGKSTVTLDIAARVSRGSAMPLEARGVTRQAADVIILTAEDHLTATVRPRLEAASAALHRVHVVQAMPRKGDPDRPPMLVAEDIARLEQIIIAKRAALVIVDPIMAFLDADTDAHRDQDMRAVLRVIAATAERTSAAILVVRHLRKGAGSALYRGAGSIGIIGAARSALLVAPDPDDPEQRVLAASKCNLAPLAASLRWRLVDHGGVARVEWLGIAEGVTADALAAVPDPVSRDEDASDLDRAVGALREVLADGPVPTKQAMAAAAELAGCSLRTIERARQRLGVEAVRVRTPDGRRVQRVDLRLTSPPPRVAFGGVETDPSSMDEK